MAADKRPLTCQDQTIFSSLCNNSLSFLDCNPVSEETHKQEHLLFCYKMFSFSTGRLNLLHILQTFLFTARSRTFVVSLSFSSGFEFHTNLRKLFCISKKNVFLNYVAKKQFFLIIILLFHQINILKKWMQSIHFAVPCTSVSKQLL